MNKNNLLINKYNNNQRMYKKDIKNKNNKQKKLFNFKIQLMIN